MSSRVLRGALLLGLGLAAGIAQAQYKCVGADGKVSYTELPCAAGAKPGAVPPSGSAPAGSAPGSSAAMRAAAPAMAVVAYTHYDLTGNTYDVLANGLRTASGMPYPALAQWNITYDFRSQSASGRCAVSSLNTRLQLSMRLPRWTPPAGANGELVARWERFMAALRQHEEGHLEHGRSAEREVRAALQAMSAGDCPTLEARMRERFQQIVDSYSARDREYDRQTDHGRTQGAVF